MKKKEVDDDDQLDASDNKDVQKFHKHPIMGKSDLIVKDLIKNAIENTGDALHAIEWYYILTHRHNVFRHKIIALNTEAGPIMGKFRISVSFKPVPIDYSVLDPIFDLATSNSGILKLELVQARYLPAVDSSGTSDPYWYNNY